MQPQTASHSLALVLGEKYAELPDSDEGHDEALRMRTTYAFELASLWQARALADDGIPSDLSEDQLNTLLGDRAAFPEVDSWEFDVPLILVATHFHPYTQAAAPSGNITLVDPATEGALLQAIVDSGVVSLPDIT